MVGFGGNDIYFVRGSDRVVESAGGGFDRIYAFASFKLEAGSEVEMLSTVSSQTSRAGDTFRARINGNVRADGRVAIPSGSEVMGEVIDAVPLRKVGGQARLALRFTDLVLPWNLMVGYLIAGAVVGVLAAIIPAIRAARLNVLNAIAYE